MIIRAFVVPLGLEPRLFCTKNRRVASYTMGQYISYLRVPSDHDRKHNETMRIPKCGGKFKDFFQFGKKKNELLQKKTGRVWI